MTSFSATPNSSGSTSSGSPASDLLSSGVPSSSSSSSAIQKDQDDINYTNQPTNSGRSGKAKVFVCTGYSCDMTFTRAEHLARHRRKHTGEKPYECIVPGCARRFSRYDNMMQHTQTHSKTKNPRRPKSAPAKGKRGTRGRKKAQRLESSSELEQESPEVQDEPVEQAAPATTGLPSPPSSRFMIKNDRIILPHPNSLYNQQDGAYGNFYCTTSLPYSPTLSSASSTSEHDLPLRRRSAPEVRWQPYPVPRAASIQHQEVLPSLWKKLKFKSDRASPSSPPRRRLSIQDLFNPIEELDESKGSTDPQDEGVDVTENEFVALQAFGEFRKKPCLHRP